MHWCRNAPLLQGVCIACLLTGLQMWVAVPVCAESLGLISTHPGDVTTHYSSVTYALDNDNPLTGTLTVTGEPDELDVNSQFIGNSLFSLSLTVMRSTGAVVSGSVNISGETYDGPIYSGLLLQGNITDFGFQDPVPAFNPGLGEGSIFEFVVHVTGGALHAPYYKFDTAGIIMNIGNASGAPPFTGVFSSAFQNTGLSGLSDTFPMSTPEPTTMVSLGTMLGAGLLFVWIGQRRKRRATLGQPCPATR